MGFVIRIKFFYKEYSMFDKILVGKINFEVEKIYKRD